MPMAADPNSFDCTVVQACAFYDEIYYFDDLRIVEFVKKIFRHLVNTVHIFSVALSPWIRNVFGLHIDETSIRPQMVISTFCWSDNLCNI